MGNGRNLKFVQLVTALASLANKPELFTSVWLKLV